jgi:hypothetical protein
MDSMLTEISVVPCDTQMGQTHPEQHGSPAWTYISTILFGMHNSFGEDGYCCWSLFLPISDTESYTIARETDTEQQVGQICNWLSPETSSFYVSTGLFCWLNPLFVCRFQSDNCDMQFVKVKEWLNWWMPQFSIPVWSQLTSSWWRLKTLYFFQSGEVEMQTVALPHLLFSKSGKLKFGTCP